MQSRRMPKGVAIVTLVGPREPPRAPRQPKNLRSLFLTVAVEMADRLTEITKLRLVGGKLACGWCVCVCVWVKRHHQEHAIKYALA